MSKLKAISATLLAASAIGVGGLVNAPTASALPRNSCDQVIAAAEVEWSHYVFYHAMGWVVLADQAWQRWGAIQSVVDRVCLP